MTTWDGLEEKKRTLAIRLCGGERVCLPCDYLFIQLHVVENETMKYLGDVCTATQMNEINCVHFYVRPNHIHHLNHFVKM